MKTQIRFSLETFFLGFLVGLAVAKLGGGFYPVVGLKYHLSGLGEGFSRILLNNLAAAVATAFGPVMAMRMFGIRSKDDSVGLAFLYMIPILILFVNGAATGYFIGLLVQKKPLLDVLLSILPHGIFEVPAIVLAGAVGLKNIDDIEAGTIQGRAPFVLVIFLLLAGAGVEASITPRLAGVEPGLLIEDVQIPGRVVLGEPFQGRAVILNTGPRAKACSLVVAGTGSATSRDVRLERGRTTLTFNLTPGRVGEDNLTLVLWDGRPLAERVVAVKVAEPRVSIVEVPAPELYAGEDAEIPIYIENLDGNRSVLLEFRSTTGAVDYREVFLPAGRTTRFLYNTTIGQPGPRVFEITLYAGDTVLDRRELNATVAGLRISPKIRGVEIPRLYTNETARIRVTVENTGTRDGNISLLIFETGLSQLLRHGDLTQIYLTRTHRGNGIWESSNETPLEAGEIKVLDIPVTPGEPHRGTLLVFALRREVVSDAAALPVEVYAR
ncbi:MAG: stage II sporulation protein M [Euryarchaeota archaeon]|nr:stage II sporulation protein M [Euryarchaeota archaeon]